MTTPLKLVRPICEQDEFDRIVVAWVDASTELASALRRGLAEGLSRRAIAGLALPLLSAQFDQAAAMCEVLEQEAGG